MATLSMLAIAVASGRVGYCYLVGDRLRDWGISDKCAASPAAAAKTTQSWITDLRPEVVVTQKLDATCRKGKKTKVIISAIAATAAQNYVLDVAVLREHSFANKYDEAAALVRAYPELQDWLPKKRRFFDNEPRNTVLFEALSLALSVMRGPSTQLAAAMG